VSGGCAVIHIARDYAAGRALPAAGNILTL
jgi:hypothetical protein